MNKFFQQFGGMKKAQEGPEATREPSKKEPMVVDDKEAELIDFDDSSLDTVMTVGEEKATEEVCQGVDNTAATGTPTPPPLDETMMYNNMTTSTMTDTLGSDQSYDITMVASLTVSSALVLALLGWNLGFRRKQRRQRRMWKNDSQKILTRVEDVMTKLGERDEEVDALEKKLQAQEEAATKATQEKEQLQEESAKALKAKDEECQRLQGTIDELQTRQKDMDARLEEVVAELKRYVEGQQDHECQLLEQKLHASQISNTLAEREAAMEQLQQTNAAQVERIQELQQRIKSDALKAEKIIGDLTSERDERFSILQQENDAIKTTVMGMLKSTQEKYDADKVLLKKEMRKRDAKIVSLQEELWKSNALLKRVQTESNVQATMSQSMRNLISEIKDTKEAAEAAKNGTSTPPKDRRSSTYDAAETILEGDGECAEFKALETMLSPSSSM